MKSAAWEELRLLIIERAVVRGKVILSSGREADYYVDLRRVTLDGKAAPLVGAVMRELTADLEYSAAGGLTLGADPVATAMLHDAAKHGLVLDAFVVRKEEKHHGLQRRIEGPDVEGKAVLAVFPVGNGVEALAAGRLYLVDPLGNLMMSYERGAPVKGLLDDLKKLLNLSHIG